MKYIRLITILIIFLFSLSAIAQTKYPRLTVDTLKFNKTHNLLLDIKISAGHDTLYVNHIPFTSSAGSSSINHWDFTRDSSIVNNNTNGIVQIKTLPTYKIYPKWLVTLHDSAGHILTKYPAAALISNTDTIVSTVSDTTGLDLLCSGLTITDTTNNTTWFHRKIYNSSGTLIGCVWTSMTSYNPFDTIGGHIYQKDMGLSIEIVGGTASNG